MGVKRCMDCANFASAEHLAKGYARMGLGKCKAQALPPATFITAGYARECPLFALAAPELVANRERFFQQQTGKNG